MHTFMLPIPILVAEELVVLPIPNNQTKAVEENMVYTCTVKDADPQTLSNLRWFKKIGSGPDDWREITDYTGK